MHVLKIGGNELNEESFLPNLAEALKNSGQSSVVVHGGGKDIASLQERLGINPEKVDGLRVTDDDSLEASQMVLCGKVNKQIVSTLIASGIDAVGLSGIDAGLITCKKKIHPSGDLGNVGEVMEVRAELLNWLVDKGLTPVISPISLGKDGKIYNINADEAAGALASALKADLLDFISNVPGVRDGERVFGDLCQERTDELIRDGVIKGGMIPKVGAALKAVDMGVKAARIVSIEGLSNGGGTTFRGAVA